MTRSSVYFEDVDALEWKPLSEIIPGYPQELSKSLRPEAKLMNHDPESGGLTMMVRLPPGARSVVRGSHSCDEEMFLLEGDLAVDGETFSSQTYWFYPAGTIHGDTRTERGAVLIKTFSGTWDFATATDDADAAASAVRGIDVESLPWMETSEVVANYTYVGPRSKVLRVDSKTGGSTKMVHIPPHYTHPDLSYHQYTQEQFLLKGSVNETGVERHALAYWCHPPLEVHGKSFTKDEGATSLLLFDGPWEVTIVK